MKKYFLMSLVAMLAIALTSCVSIVNKRYRNDTPSQVNEIGKVTAMQAFDKLNVKAPVNVILEQSDTNSVRVEGTAEQLAKMTIYVDNDGLTVDVKESSSVMFGDNKNEFQGVQVFVSAALLKDIKISGAGNVAAPSALNVGDINMNISGAGDMNIAQLTCQNLDIKITGAGDVTMGAVQADAVTANVTGAGNIEMAGLIAKSLDNKTTGAGDMVFNNLNVDVVKSHITGAGNITLSGTVGSHEEKITGAGSIDVSGLK